MRFGVWFSGILSCSEGWLQHEGGNGRLSRAEFSSEQDAEENAFWMQRQDERTAYFVMPLVHTRAEFVNEHAAHRERVKERLRKRLR